MWQPRKADRIGIQGGDLVFAVAAEYASRGMVVPVEWALNSCQLKAMVPTIPPTLRPPHALRGYAVLWEAHWTVGG